MHVTSKSIYHKGNAIDLDAWDSNTRRYVNSKLSNLSSLTTDNIIILIYRSQNIIYIAYDSKAFISLRCSNKIKWYDKSIRTYLPSCQLSCQYQKLSKLKTSVNVRERKILCTVGAHFEFL